MIGRCVVEQPSVSSREPSMLPVVEELSPAPAVEDVFQRLAQRPHCVFLDSARRDAALGRYSFVAADPFEFRLANEKSAAAIDLLTGLKQFESETAPGLPPFQGGAAGFWGYEALRGLNGVPAAKYDEFQVPLAALGLYDVVVAFDHMADRAWIISQGLPEVGLAARRRRAESRLQEMRGWLRAPLPPTLPSPQRREGLLKRSANALASQFEVPGRPGVTSNFSRDAYLHAVRRVIDYIRAGDVFQVNLAQRLLCPAQDDAIALYLRLRRQNPAAFAAYFDMGQFQIASASPERFLTVRDREVETRPIKGTRSLTGDPEVDRHAAEELLASAKDRAENVMIVDLMRNDLSRVCRPESVRVTQLCQVERAQYVQHFVSAVRGKLRAGCGAIDLLQAAFPGGSVTGAPKRRAMEIIAELEPTARGPYCGALGYIGFDGTMDTNILIRTITAGRGWWQFPVGGGIVAQSDPKCEYEETWSKAEGILKAIS